ncbi:MAG: class I SAM-dependent methyltransferase [Armatimonadetes bacterium]|nr:class I SAM-dependent methyltransferase [Armatimonadota bacterium]
MEEKSGREDNMQDMEQRCGFDWGNPDYVTYLDISRRQIERHYQEFIPLFLDFIGMQRKSKILDAGCGLGFIGRLLERYFPDGTIYGVDIEKELIVRARKLNKELGSRVKLEVQDVNHLRFPKNSFDLVICQSLLINLPNPKDALKQMIQVTRPGGRVVVVEPFDEQIHYYPQFSKEINNLLLKHHKAVEKAIRKNSAASMSVTRELPQMFLDLGLTNVKALGTMSTDLTCDEDDPDALRKAQLYHDRSTSMNKDFEQLALQGGLKPHHLEKIKDAEKRWLKRITAHPEILKTSAEIHCAMILVLRGEKPKE